ncbi:uncharacterized protein LOC122380401 [Amphibalanus amphitrite]|uniref:uncharacterized protein LOC122380401 n=1 Tax=Amphibalanus amphitrite TaxID=1232801 RepID=UPI001C90CC5E|nr:uncharacterized protein LOC122380401 [Amphibalanus amphitrite]
MVCYLYTNIPFRFCPQLWKEMELIAGKPVQQEYNAALGAVLDKVVEKTSRSREDAALVLLRLLGEEGTVVMEAPAATMTRPLIHERETSFDIVVEETVMASAQCLEEALLLFGVAHYVFNQKVSRASRSTMWFIVHDILGLPAESTATADALKNLSVLTA